MPTLTAPNGKRYETKNVPFHYTPCFCSSCGNRIGWISTQFGENFNRVTCEDCIADMQEED